jgi:hypothetical protein
MIYVRDDDVLINSSSHEDPVKHFKKIHRWICEAPDKLLHVPALLMYNKIADQERGVIGFPEAMEFIKDETAAGRMRPEIHGYEHKDYKLLTKDRIVTELEICKDFLWCSFDTEATKWYTPWGANAPHLYEAASEAGLELIDCSKINKLRGRYGVVQEFRDGRHPSYLEEKDIFFHWWEGGLRLKRAIEVIKHGDWATAKANNDLWFEE